MPIAGNVFLVSSEVTTADLTYDITELDYVCMNQVQISSMDLSKYNKIA